MKWNIGWGITSSCNMMCEFCYSKSVRNRVVNTPINDCIKFIKENAGNINSINYGTGENSLSSNWFSLINYVHTSHHIPQALTTNGYIVEATRKDKFAFESFANSIQEVDVSLDFWEKDKHNNMRGSKYVYDWAINTLKMCQSLGIETTIVFVGMKCNMNIENISGLFNIAEKFGAKVRMNLYRPTIGVNENSQKYIPTYSQIINILEYINEYHHVLSIDDPLFGSLICANYNYVDPSGQKSIRILPNGDITPSTYLISENYRIGNITTPNILRSLTQQFFENSCKQCEACNYYSTCRGGVIDRRILWHNTLNAPDPYCPIVNNNKLPSFKIKEDSENIRSIHHGYLPTMFFAP